MMSYYAGPGNQLEGSLWTYKYKPKKPQRSEILNQFPLCIEVV
jgi:hypothetical protein